jgi:tetratricopeptide (TPR) repeat protein
MKLAKIMILFNEVDAASAYCQKVINLNLEKFNNKSEALALIAHIQVIKGNKSEAFELFKELLKTPASTQSLKIAIIDLIQLNPRLAEAVCKKVIKRDIELREWHRVYFLLACCYVKIGEYQKATRIFEEIEKFEPGIYLVQEFHAISLFYHGEKKESLMKFMMIKNRFPFDVVNSSNFDMVFENLQGAMKGQSSLDVHSNAGNCRNGQDCQKLLVPNLTIFGFPCSEA